MSLGEEVVFFPFFRFLFWYFALVCQFIQIKAKLPQRNLINKEM
jgi:hypothetical protein